MKIFKYSIIYKVWTIISQAYNHSNYHKLGLFFHNALISSVTSKKANKVLMKKDSSTFASMTLAIISFIIFPLRWLSKQADLSLSKKMFASFSREVNNNFIFTILLILTASTFGINMMYFIRGEHNVWLMTSFIFSIILFIVYQKVEKYIPYSIISRLLKDLFYQGEEL